MLHFIWDAVQNRMLAQPLRKAMPMVSAPVESQDVNDNGAVTFGDERVDAGWIHADGTNVFSFQGSPDRVRINCMVSFAIADNENFQRPAPVIELSRNGALVASARTGYIRDTADHEESSSTISFTDPSPGVDPVYTITSRQETTQGGVVTADLGHFSAEALL